MTSGNPEGFSYRTRKSGDVEILHFGKPAGLLREMEAVKFLSKAQGADELTLQHLMARVTGNYKRGNERNTAAHQRNR
ncbi:MAG: hypothetical protein R3F41_18365 [Gammaproteobacteria bacterium]|nr:hypothetical protein [Pseudomonadales bacterium]MCP5347515.1 hypothetical protein [Pseudomonadales bacterium]